MQDKPGLSLKRTPTMIALETKLHMERQGSGSKLV